MDLGSQVLAAFRWAAGARFFGQLVTWSVTVVVIRVLTPDDYGLMTMATMFMSFLTMLNEFGMGAALVQKQDLDELSLREVFGLIIALNFLCFILLLATSPMIAAFFGEPRLKDILQALSLQFAVSPFGVIPQSLLERKLNFKAKSMVDVMVTTTGALITLMLALKGFGVWALVWGNLAFTSLRTLGLNFASPYLCRPRFCLSDLRKIVSFGGMVTATRVVWLFYSQADVFVIGKLLGKEQLGFYGVAMQLASLPMEKANGIINQVAFPAFARIQTEPTSVKAFLLKAIRVMGFFAFPVFFGISCAADELVAVGLGATWQSAALPLQLLSTVMALRMISNVLHTAVQGLGRPDISLIKLLIASIIMPTAFYVGSYWGVVGVSLAWVLAYPIAFLILLWLALPVTNIRFAEFVAAIARPALASIGMFIVVMITKVFLMEDIIPLVRLITLVMVGVIVYGGLAAGLFYEGAREAAELVKRSLGGRVATLPS